MNIVLTILAVITLVGGIYFNKQGTAGFRAQEVQAPEVLSQETDSNQPELPPLPEEPQITSTPSPKPTVKPTPLVTPAPSSLAPNSSASLDSFIYPGASVVSRSSSKLTLTSGENPNTVKNWYKNKFKELDMNAVASTQNNVNGNVKNKLAGDNGQTNAEIEITKDSGASLTTIIVELD